MELIIDRSKWRTGGKSDYSTGEGDTKLLNSEGFMCCLGFYCEQIGIPKEQIFNKASPSSIMMNPYKPETANILLESNLITKEAPYSHSEFCKELIILNDKDKLTTEQREELIRSKFLQKNISITFKNQYNGNT